jgi:uroporphyrinogen-III synthase
MSHALSGLSVLVTRPMPQAAMLADRLREEGVIPIVFPGIRIELVQDAKVAESVRTAREAHILVFVSPTAVGAAMPMIRAAGGLPATTQVAAIGPGTARALREHGIGEVIMATEGHDSEALADHPVLQDVAGKRIALIRGVGGRALLADTLRDRGALLELVECYRRLPPTDRLTDALSEWSAAPKLAWSATSAEILDNLFALAGEASSAMLRSQVLLVPHARIAARAFTYGVARILVTGPGDVGLVSGLNVWFGKQRPLKST